MTVTIAHQSTDQGIDRWGVRLVTGPDVVAGRRFQAVQVPGNGAGEGFAHHHGGAVPDPPQLLEPPLGGQRRRAFLTRLPHRVCGPAERPDPVGRLPGPFQEVGDALQDLDRPRDLSHRSVPPLRPGGGALTSPAAQSWSSWW